MTFLGRSEPIESAKEKSTVRNAAAAFAVAADMAHSNGLKLVQKNETHYQLRGNRWLLNLYPGNQRIYADRQQANTPPWLNVPDPWTLTDVVRAAIGASKCK